MRELVHHLFGLFVGKYGMNRYLRLFDAYVDDRITQLITNASFLGLQLAVADSCAQVLQRLVLTITDLSGKRVVEFGYLFGFHLVQGHLEIGFFPGDFLICIVSRYGGGKGFALTWRHSDNMLIHAAEEAMPLVGEFKRIIL